ncbi:hypothetical protein P886_4977 [Alteromonadaceae bacterium 2753L.S.0a.02]|nr:hypothetical protein P886_4977 [Alteromonadaceae bacterium 2753L.S.0a.02]
MLAIGFFGKPITPTAILFLGAYHFMWEELAKALCLVLILEGILPFLYPNRWRELVATLARIDDKSLRLIGLLSMVLGAALLWFVK